MAAIDSAEVRRLLEATTGKTTYTNPTTPMKLRLYTAVGNDTTEGTVVTGGSYTSQTIAWDAASGRLIRNNGAISFTLMPAATVTAVEVWDSNGTPRRALWGALTASKTVDAGDTLTFADDAITLSVT